MVSWFLPHVARQLIVFNFVKSCYGIYGRIFFTCGDVNVGCYIWSKDYLQMRMLTMLGNCT